jgi:hypothetical protein
MRTPCLAVLLLLSHNFPVLAAPAVDEDTSVGPPRTLAPGQAPILPQAGPLAEPRSSDQVGFPSARLRLPQLPWVRSCSSTVGSQVMALSPVPRATIRLAPSPTAGPRQSASTAASVNATPQWC